MYYFARLTCIVLITGLCLSAFARTETRLASSTYSQTPNSVCEVSAQNNTIADLRLVPKLLGVPVQRPVLMACIHTFKTVCHFDQGPTSMHQNCVVVDVYIGDDCGPTGPLGGGGGDAF